MKVIYRAFDGTEFDNDTACIEYEKKTRDSSVIMMDCSENIVTKTECAAVVWLKDKNSAGIFHDMAKWVGDEASAHTIPEREWGFYFWDECDEKYVWVPNESLELLIALRGEVLARGEDV